jgi:glycosyltransferase involved in cell wall biosynthesis
MKVLKSGKLVDNRENTGKYVFHLLGLCHLPCSKEYMSCAFTQKNYKLSRMLLSLGHEVYYYGAEGSDVPCTQFIQTHTLSDIRQDYGDGDNRFEVGYDWTNTDFRHDFNTDRKLSTLKFYKSCIEHINKVKEDNDFLLCTQGYYHKPIADEVNLFLTCEPGVGYRGSCHRFRAFESAYIQNFTYGSQHPFECINGSYYDRVIPNYFDEEDVEFNAKPEGDYFFFIGRMIKRKGILTAYLTAKALNKKLIIAGQGGVVLANGNLTATTTPDFEINPATWEYVGFVDVERRKEYMKNAIATFTPTEYLECFAGTHIESMLHGTPVITTDFGVFPGTVINGVNGYRCSTLDDFVWAAKNIGKMDRIGVRKSGERYLMDYVKWEYQKWFDDLMAVYESAVDSSKKGWHRIREKEPEWGGKVYGF